MSNKLKKNTYLENHSNNQFLDLSVIESDLVMRRGIVGRACLVLNTTLNEETCNAMFAQIKDHFVQLGYKEQAVEQDIIEGCHAIAINSDDIRDHPLYGEFFNVPNVNCKEPDSRRQPFSNQG